MEPKRPTFPNPAKTQFRQVLLSRVEQYFAEKKIAKHGDWRLWTKAVILLTAFVGEYIVFLATDIWWLRILNCLFLALTLAMIGFNIMHDANHGAFSSKDWVNKLFGLTLNLMNGYDHWWKQKHNVFHHTYTNIVGADEDIAIPLMRVHQEQSRKGIHRYQQWYWPFMYGMTYIAWIFINDFRRLFTKKVGPYSFSVPKREWVRFTVSKSFSMTIWIVIPVLLLGWQTFLLSYLIVSIVCGFFIAIIFQMAHVVEKADQPTLFENKSLDELAIHQVRTTANFACDNTFLRWICGGLNFQVEHHLLYGISHVHYPALRPIVQQTCADFGVEYNQYPTFAKALSSHVALLRYLGRND